jgi:hypothetical protein
MAAVFLLLGGCLGPSYDPSRQAVIGPGATGGACGALLENVTAPSAIVRLEPHRGEEQVHATVDGEDVAFRDTDDDGCASIPFTRAGFYRFHAWGSCAAQAETWWNGTETIEVWIPYHGKACM